MRALQGHRSWAGRLRATRVNVPDGPSLSAATLPDIPVFVNVRTGRTPLAAAPDATESYYQPSGSFPDPLQSAGILSTGGPSILKQQAGVATFSIDPTGQAKGSSWLAPSEAQAVRRLILAAFLVRAACAVVLHGSGYSRILAPDEQTYAGHGWAIALYWLGETVAPPSRYASGQPLGYFQLNALFFLLFGRNELPIKIANAAIGALTLRYIYLLGRELYGSSVAYRAASISAYLPSLVLWSSVNIRDAWVIFLIAFSAWQGLRIQAGRSPSAVFWYAAAVLLVSRFRDYLVYVLLVPPVAVLLIARGQRMLRNFAVAVVLAVVGLLMIQQGIVGRLTESRLTLEALAEVRQNMATGGSAFEVEADISTPGAALTFLPIGLAYFFFSPFPWQITTTLKALALPEVLFLYSLVPSVTRGIRWILRNRFLESAQVLLLISLIAVSYALGSGNVGTMYRHRAQAIVLLLIIAALGMHVRGRPDRDPDSGRGH